MKTETIKFRTWTGLEGCYFFDDADILKVKLLSKMPKRFYYSALNEVEEYFEKEIAPGILGKTIRICPESGIYLKND